MRRFILALLPLGLLANTPPPTMLAQAAEIARAFAPLIAKAPPPSPLPQTEALLRSTNNWLRVDLAHITASPTQLASLAREALWQQLAEMGFDGVELVGLKSTTSLALNPRFGTLEDYQTLATRASAKGVQLIGRLLGDATGRGLDFGLALKNVGAYPELYGLIEIPSEDWALLPTTPSNALSVNVPWLTLQALHKKGYVPVDFDPYVKQTDWDVTQPIACEDHVLRRWLFRHNAAGSPKLDWLSPSFAAERVAAGDILASVEQLSQSVLLLDGACPPNALETMSLTTRKLGAFSALARPQGVAALRETPTDVSYDPFTPQAALHALIARDADALRQIYQRFLDEGVRLSALVHAPASPSEPLCEDRFQYDDERQTDALLKERLLKGDVVALDAPRKAVTTWLEVCRTAAERLGEKELLPLQLLLMRFFAWQPGVFTMSLEDLLGASGDAPLDPLGVNQGVLYPSLLLQLQNPSTLAAELRETLRARRELGVERGELVEVLGAEHPGVLLLRLELSGRARHAVLALNVGGETVSELVEAPEYAQTNAVDVESGIALEKPVESSLFTLNLGPRSIRLVVFQPAE